MKLQTRLVATFSLLLLIVVAVVGIAVVGSTRSVLVGAIDEDLAVIQAGIRDKFLNSTDLLEQVTLTVDPDRPAVKSPQALVIVDVQERTVEGQASGFTDDPDPLPNIETFANLIAKGEISTISSEDNSLNYRAFAWATDTGEIGVWAVPLAEVDSAVSNLVRTFAITAVIVAVFGALATWFAVRRELRPVDQMVDTATAIAAGDLTQRVDVIHSSTELGRLGTALNEMLVQIEDAIIEEQNAKARLTDFVADASHELRTPIAAVLGYSELYRQGALVESKDIDNAMRRIGTETSRMERLVGDLLLLARLDRQQAFKPTSVNLTEVVRDAVTNSEAIDADYPITFDVVGSIRVMGDEQRLTQVVANLLANARVHTPKGTSVAVSLREKDHRVILNVIDDGPGLPEEEAGKLFERFYRIDSSRSRDTGGAGLGLAIVAAIVAAHDGTIEASNEDGHGARVTVSLPIADPS
ncbi:MAG: HAMP domain-containing histidine kinase [Chloroflexi bacterium]|jgi:two-component system, OmpR family, sensor kinase|nr:HAMP domain-containing histidine kinase [Chloroflexota bacterium]